MLIKLKRFLNSDNSFEVCISLKFQLTFLQGEYDIVSLAGSFIRAEQGGKTGGLTVSLSSSDGQIIGGAVGTHLIAAGPVQVNSFSVLMFQTIFTQRLGI